MDRFSEETASDLMRNYNGLDLVQSEVERCLYCNRTGGVPFLMTGDGEVLCSRCFEDFTETEFHAWLAESPLLAAFVSVASGRKSLLGVKHPVMREVA